MRTYLDTSAVVKLIVNEPESEALLAFLADAPDDGIFSSTLLETETRRAARRHGAAQSVATEALASINLLVMTRPLLNAAGLLPGPTLRSLDAIHLATALEHGADVLVTYDHRLQQAATDLGIETAAPA